MEDDALFRLQLDQDIGDLLPKIMVKDTDLALDIMDNCSLLYRMNLLGLGEDVDWTDAR